MELLRTYVYSQFLPFLASFRHHLLYHQSGSWRFRPRPAFKQNCLHPGGPGFLLMFPFLTGDPAHHRVRDPADDDRVSHSYDLRLSPGQTTDNRTQHPLVHWDSEFLMINIIHSTFISRYYLRNSFLSSQIISYVYNRMIQ